MKGRLSSLSSLIPHPSSLILVLLLLAQAGAARAECVWGEQKSRTMAWLHAVYFLDLYRGWAVGSNGTLLATTDGGATWAAMRRPTEDTLRDIYFADAATGWLVCERNIYRLKTVDEPRTYLMKTGDGGRTWQQVNVIGTIMFLIALTLVVVSGTFRRSAKSA